MYSHLDSSFISQSTAEIKKNRDIVPLAVLYGVQSPWSAYVPHTMGDNDQKPLRLLRNGVRMQKKSSSKTEASVGKEEIFQRNQIIYRTNVEDLSRVEILGGALISLVDLLSHKNKKSPGFVTNFIIMHSVFTNTGVLLNLIMDLYRKLVETDDSNKRTR